MKHANHKKYAVCEEIEVKRGLDNLFYSPKVVLEIARLFFDYLDGYKIWGPLLILMISLVLIFMCMLWRANDVVLIIEALKS